MNKPFCEYFLKYQPKKEHFAFIDKITDWNVRIDRESRRVEIDAALCEHVSQPLMYEIENCITEAYSLLSTRIFPRYDSSEFGLSAMKEIINEALRTGLVNNGFFDGASYEIGDEKVCIKIPFLESGVDYLAATKCKSIISAIIDKRYGLTREIVIECSDDCEQRNRERQASLDRLLYDYDKKTVWPPLRLDNGQ